MGLVCFISWAAATGKEYFFFHFSNMPFGDKISHFVLIGTLALLVNLSLQNRRIKIGTRYWLLGSVIVLIGVTLEETSQQLFANRSFDLVDLAANYVGIYCFGWLAIMLLRKKSRHQWVGP